MGTAEVGHRWCLFIDVEGFSSIYDTDEPQALSRWRELASAIYKFIEALPPTFPPIGAHQIGDGFLLVATSSGEAVDQPLALAIALLRHLLMQGVACKAAISEGNFADVCGCLPRCIRQKMDETSAIRDDRYIMTFWPVMGTALIQAFNLAKSGPSGPLLLLDATSLEMASVKAMRHKESLIIVDWLRSVPPALPELEHILAGAQEQPEGLALQLRRYVEGASGLSAEWRANALRLAEGTEGT